MDYDSLHEVLLDTIGVLSGEIVRIQSQTDSLMAISPKVDTLQVKIHEIPLTPEVGWLMTNSIPLMAASVAMLAVILSIYNNRASRKHNKLSVRPLLAFEYSRGGSNDWIGFELQNNGFGPAFIKRLDISYDGKKLNSTMELLEIIQHKFPINQDFQFKTYGDKSTMIQNQSNKILTIDSQSPNLETVIDIFDKVSFAVKYESIYKVEFQQHIDTWKDQEVEIRSKGNTQPE